MPTPSKFPLPDNEHSFGTDPPSMTRRFANIAHQSDKASPQSWLCSFLRAEKLTSQRARGTRVDYVYNRRNQLTRMLQTKAATVLLGLSYLLNPDGSRARHGGCQQQEHRARQCHQQFQEGHSAIGDHSPLLSCPLRQTKG